MTELEIGYIAGIVDGEGCVYVNRRKATGRRKTIGHSVKVVVTTTSHDLVKWLECHAELTSICYSEPKGNRKPKWLCTWNNSKAEWLLELILPYLVIKTPQAILGLELLRHLRSTPFHRGVCLSPEVIAYRESIKQDIAKLNFRGKAC